jgi:hypothetical protein
MQFQQLWNIAPCQLVIFTNVSKKCSVVSLAVKQSASEAHPKGVGVAAGLQLPPNRN